MPPAVFEPTVSAGERPQTYALDCAATGTGTSNKYKLKNLIKFEPYYGVIIVNFTKIVNG